MSKPNITTNWTCEACGYPRSSRGCNGCRAKANAYRHAAAAAVQRAQHHKGDRNGIYDELMAHADTMEAFAVHCERTNPHG